MVVLASFLTFISRLPYEIPSCTVWFNILLCERLLGACTISGDGGKNTQVYIRSDINTVLLQRVCGV